MSIIAAKNCKTKVGKGVLKEFILTTTEWNYIDTLKELLERFEKVKVSGSTYPTISRTIAYYNTLIDHIEGNKCIISNLDSQTQADDLQLNSGAMAACQKLKKGYSKTDLTPVYSVATAMN
ncbi:unnamed protein product, partial [Absidia cylindrospora]